MSSLPDQYKEQGFVFPLRAFGSDTAKDYRRQFKAAEGEFGATREFREIIFGSADFALPFVDQICRLPAILDPVKQLLDDNLLVWGAGFFIKEPKSQSFISWHQDLTYWGLSDQQEVTAWVALSDATRESGCMRFVAGSHLQGMVAHRDTFADDNLLTRGQQIDVEVDEAKAVDVVLAPGEFSLHHGRMFHGSGPNRSFDRRIGLAIRYITPEMHQTSGEKPWAHLVSGENTCNHFQILPPTTRSMERKYIEAYQYNVRVREQDLFAGTEGKGKRAVPAAAHPSSAAIESIQKYAKDESISETSASPNDKN